MPDVNFRQVAFETPFEGPIKPYTDNMPIAHLKGLLDQYEEFFKQDIENHPKLVGDYHDYSEQEEEPLFNSWLENIYNKKEEIQ